MSAMPALRICFLCCTISTAMWAQNNNASKLVITMPGEPWTLAFNAKDFSVNTNGMQPDRRAYLRAENSKNMMILSVYLERVQGVATEADCQKTQKERLDQKVGYRREKIETRQSAGMEIVEYTIPEFDGAPVQQRNLFACIAKDDVYVDIHLSKVLFKPDDERLFTAVLDSAQFVPAGDPKQ